MVKFTPIHRISITSLEGSVIKKREGVVSGIDCAIGNELSLNQDVADLNRVIHRSGYSDFYEVHNGPRLVRHMIGTDRE